MKDHVNTTVRAHAGQIDISFPLEWAERTVEEAYGNRCGIHEGLRRLLTTLLSGEAGAGELQKLAVRVEAARWERKEGLR